MWSPRLLRLVAFALVAALGASPVPSLAQAMGLASNPAEELALRLGARDGRSEGLLLGHNVGRDQVLSRAWLTGFAAGLSEGGNSWRVRDAWSEGERAGRAAGYPEGWDLGLAAGRERASTAYGRLDGRPSFRPEPVDGSVSSPPSPPRFSACDAPSALAFPLSGGRSTWIRPASCESDEPPARWKIPKPNIPSEGSLRETARQEGISTGEALTEFVNAYREYYREHFEPAFLGARDTVARLDQDRAEADGRRSGATEGARREACNAFAAAHLQGWRSGLADGHARGFEEGWRETATVHDTQAVVVVERATLEDASGDGVIEPGEQVSLAVILANAGLVDAAAPVASWQGRRGLAGEGRFERPLAAQTRRTETIALGPADPGAPFGSSLVAAVVAGTGAGAGRVETVTAPIGRPLVLESVTVDLDARDGLPVRSVKATVRCAARTRVDRGARVRSGDVESVVGPLEGGAAGQVVLVLGGPVALGADLEAVVELVDGAGTFWMQRGTGAEIPMHQLVQVAGRVTNVAPFLDVALSRLTAELDDAREDRKLLKRERTTSDLAEYAASLRGLPAAARERFEREVSSPLLASVEGRGTPRSVRKAVREALGVN